jgi:hypothetical protein
VLRLALEALCQFGGHARVHFHGDAFAGGLEDAGCEVAGSGTDFEDGVSLFEKGFGDDGICDAWILEDVLARRMSVWERRRGEIFANPKPVFILNMLCAAFAFAAGRA